MIQNKHAVFQVVISLLEWIQRVGRTTENKDDNCRALLHLYIERNLNGNRLCYSFNSKLLMSQNSVMVLVRQSCICARELKIGKKTF